MTDTFTPVALKLHAFGLNLLQDPNWTGMNLFDKIKQHVRGRIQPFELLRKPIERGLPYQLGCWFFEELFDADYAESLKDEYLLWHLDDLVGFITFHNATNTSSTVDPAIQLIKRIDEIYEHDEYKYFEFLESESGSEELFNCTADLLGEFEPAFSKLKGGYAEQFSDRVVHDRQLCAYISEIVVRIGFDGDDDDSGTPRQWVDRVVWPERIKSILRARERGKCAKCGADLVMELENETHIDHVIPIARGGCNDIVNLQILCKPCNLKKSSNNETVKSSVPEYIKRVRRAK